MKFFEKLYRILSPKYEKVYVVETFDGKHTYRGYKSAQITADMYRYSGDLRRVYSTRRKRDR